jgi:hypothetical protein
VPARAATWAWVRPWRVRAVRRTVAGFTSPGYPEHIVLSMFGTTTDREAPPVAFADDAETAEATR